MTVRKLTSHIVLTDARQMPTVAPTSPSMLCSSLFSTPPPSPCLQTPYGSLHPGARHSLYPLHIPTPGLWQAHVLAVNATVLLFASHRAPRSDPTSYAAFPDGPPLLVLVISPHLEPSEGAAA